MPNLSSHFTRASQPNSFSGEMAFGSSRLPIVTSIHSEPTYRKCSDVPHPALNPRSTASEDLNQAGVPRVQVNSDMLASARAMNGAPTAFWHILQWQTCGFLSGPVMRNRTAPHWQPPVRTLLWSSGAAVSCTSVPFKWTIGRKPIAGQSQSDCSNIRRCRVRQNVRRASQCTCHGLECRQATLHVRNLV